MLKYVLLTLLLMPLSLSAVANDARLTLTGSSTIAPLILDIGKRFEKLNPNVRIDVQSGGSSRGLSDSRSGLADIGMVSRELKENEKDLSSALIARDGIAIILHKSNPIKELTNEQIVAVYTGKVNNWKAVGGQDQRITVVNKAEGRSTLELFTHYLALQNRDIKAHVIIGDNQQGIKTVAGNPGAIGYVSIGTAEFEADYGTPIKLLPLHGIAASVANVTNGSFPLTRQLNLVTKQPPTGLSKRFIDYIHSGQANDIIKEHFFVPALR